jgi:hypothetical protein
VRAWQKGEFCSVLQYNKLIRMYGAHGRLDDAVKVFRVSYLE